MGMKTTEIYRASDAVEHRTMIKMYMYDKTHEIHDF